MKCDSMGRRGKKMATVFNLDDRIKAAVNAAFEEAGEELFDDSQLIGGVWFNPTWGCDTVQHFIDALKDCEV